MKKHSSYKKEGNRFHKKLEKILDKAGFKILRSDTSAKGPDIIIESHGKTIIIQCRHSPEGNYYQKLEDDVDSYSNKLKRYHADRAVIALSGYKHPKLQPLKLEKWLNKYGVAVWTDPMLKNYESLVKSIGTYTKYQILGDLELNVKFDEDLSTPAIQVKQRRFKFFLTKLSPEFLLKVAFVARRAQGESSYQRYLSKKRVKTEIPDFIEGKEGIFPNNIILVSKSKLNFNKNLLGLPARIASFWVIDGQHRLYSFCNIRNKELLNKYELSCTIFDGSNIKLYNQAEIFITINTKAKKAEPPLIIELAETFGFDYESRAIGIYKKLQKTPYFLDKIKTYTKGKGMIDSNTFVRSTALKDLIRDNGPILWGKSTLSDKKKTELCYYYRHLFFKIVYNNFRNEWKRSKTYILSTNQGYRSLLRLFIKILNYTKKRKDERAIRQIIKAFKQSNPLIKNAELKGKYAGEGGALILANEWAKGINEIIPGFDKSVQKTYGIEIDKVKIYKGELEKSEIFLERVSKKIKGILIGELSFVDTTTLNYLDAYFSHCEKFNIVFSHIKTDDKNKFNKRLNELRSSGKKIILVKCEKIHERWLGDEHHYIELKADLKKDALANSDHEMCLYEYGTDKKKIEEFDENWTNFRRYTGRKIIYDWSMEKENED